MNASIHRQIKDLIEETNSAYGIFASMGNMNADYAEFAGLSLSEFKEALQRPDLTKRELVRMLRRANNRHKAANPKSCWATFLASYVADVSNGNGVRAEEERRAISESQ